MLGQTTSPARRTTHLSSALACGVPGTLPDSALVDNSGDDKGFDLFQCMHFGALRKIEIPAHLQV